MALFSGLVAVLCAPKRKVVGDVTARRSWVYCSAPMLLQMCMGSL